MEFKFDNCKLLNIQISKAKCYPSSINSSVVVTHYTLRVRTWPTFPYSFASICNIKCCKKYFCNTQIIISIVPIPGLSVLLFENIIAQAASNQN